MRELKSTYDNEILNKSNIEDIRIVIRDAAIRGQHQRQTNSPVVNEIAVMMSVNEDTTKRDIIEGMPTAYIYALHEFVI